MDKDAHIYETRAVTSRLAVPIHEPAVPRTPVPVERPSRPGGIGTCHSHRPAPSPDRRYAPPSLVVTDERALVHVSESGGQYLQIGRGEPSRDVLQLIHPDLRLDLWTALHQAAQQRSNVTVRVSR